MPTQRIAICLVALIAISNATAQQTTLRVPPTLAEETIRVNFPGGPLEALLTRIVEDNAVAINVIVSDEGRGVEIPPLDLQNVRIGDVMKALGSLGHLELSVIGEIYSVIPRRVRQYPSGVQIYDIRALVTSEHDTAILFGVEDIVTAMKISWEMARDDGPRPELKLHEETRLLVVYGNSAQQEIAKSVLEKLQNSQIDATWERERERKIDAADQLQRKVEVLMATVTELKQSNRVLMEENKRKTVDAAKLRAEMRGQRATLRDLEDSNRYLKKELDAAKKGQGN